MVDGRSSDVSVLAVRLGAKDVARWRSLRPAFGLKEITTRRATAHRDHHALRYYRRGGQSRHIAEFLVGVAKPGAATTRWLRDLHVSDIGATVAAAKGGGRDG